MGIRFFGISEQDMYSTLVASCSTIKNTSIKATGGRGYDHHKFLANTLNISDFSWAVFKD